MKVLPFRPQPEPDFLARVVALLNLGWTVKLDGDLARRIAACVNACRDCSTEGLEKIVTQGRTLRLAMQASLAADPLPIPMSCLDEDALHAEGGEGSSKPALSALGDRDPFSSSLHTAPSASRVQGSLGGDL